MSQTIKTLKEEPLLFLAATVLTGIAVPLSAFGIVFIQAALGLALILLLCIAYKDTGLRNRFSIPLKTPPGIALHITFAIWFVVTPWSTDFGESFTTVLRTALYILGSILIWAFLSVSESRVRLALVCLMGASTLSIGIAAFCLLFPETSDPILNALHKRQTDSIHFFKAYAAASVCLIPVLIWAGGKLGKRWSRLGWGLALPALFIIIATSNRAAIAGLVAVLFILIVLMVWNRSRLLSLVVMMAIPAIVLPWVWWTRRLLPGASTDFMPAWLVDSHRQFIWQFTLEKFSDSPWAGWGANRINFAPGADTYSTELKGIYISSHPHNWILEILSECGIFGLTALLIALGLLAWRLILAYNRTKDSAYLALITLSTAFFASSLFNFSIWSTWWLLTYFVLFAIISASHGKPFVIKKILTES